MWDLLSLDEMASVDGLDAILWKAFPATRGADKHYTWYEDGAAGGGYVRLDSATKLSSLAVTAGEKTLYLVEGEYDRVPECAMACFGVTLTLVGCSLRSPRGR